MKLNLEKLKFLLEHKGLDKRVHVAVIEGDFLKAGDPCSLA